jgi:hypothetical protein
MSTALPRLQVAAGELLQHVSRVRYRGSPLHFGRDGTKRYDASDDYYGVLYLAPDLPTALMESVFHKHQWPRRKTRAISVAEVGSRLVRAVGVIEDLSLADLTAPGAVVQHFGMNLAQVSSRRYTHTQRISKSVYGTMDAAGAPVFDGLCYPSRNNYPAHCVALFDRAAHKVKVIDDIDLADHAQWASFVSAYDIAIVKPGRGRSRTAA